MGLIEAMLDVSVNWHHAYINLTTGDYYLGHKKKLVLVNFPNNL